jgi:hypothetical protein
MKRAVAFLIGLLVCSLALADFAIVNSSVGRRTNDPRWAMANPAEVWRLAQTPYTQVSAAVESDYDDPVPVRHEHKHKSSGSRERTFIGQNYVLNADETADGDVVVIRGHAQIEGAINGDLVLVGSDAKMKGTVNGDLTSIASTISFEPGATVNGDFTSFMSALHDANQATVNGDRTNLDVLPPQTLAGLGNWLSGTVLFLRPMSPGSVISWLLALGGLVFSLAIGGAFPKLLTETGLILRQRAPASFLSGIAIVPATALFCFLLTLTVVGILAVPLVLAALLVFALIGEAAIFRLIGEAVAPKLGQKPHAPYFWITIGALICWILYFVPVIGFLAGSVVFLAGLGAFTIYVVDRSRNQKTVGLPQSGIQPNHSATPPGTTPAGSGPTETSPGKSAAGGSISPSASLAAPLTGVAARADRGYQQFWQRLAANLIDLVLLFAIEHSLGLTRILIPAWILYRFAMYVWRSATLGEIVLNLQVQKLDGTTLTGDYSTALIRALSSLLSLLPAGLGFIWILFDPERNTWHDKISGTRVVQVRQSPQSSVAPKPQEPPSPPE